jgi:hypothetical protein
MELKRDEIIKALECCSNNDECAGEACPYYKTGCEKNMPKDSLSLIKELTEENERLSNRTTCQVVFPDEKLEEIKNECLERVELDIKAIQADTIQKMYKMLHDKVKTIYTDENDRLWYDIVELEDIDRIVEELKEETN